MLKRIHYYKQIKSLTMASTTVEGKNPQGWELSFPRLEAIVMINK